MPFDDHGSPHAIGPVTAAPRVTFADVLDRIASDTGLPATRRRDLCSSIRCLLRLLELDPARVPAAAAALRQKLRHLHPAQAEISKKRLANMKADVTFALRHLGLTGSTLRNGKGLDPAWQRLWAAIADDQVRWKLSRLFRFCSSLGIDPGAVDDSTVDRLFQALQEESLLTDPQSTIKATVYAWNRCHGEVPGWPRQRLTRISTESTAWTFPLDQFPKSFQADVERWLCRLKGEDRLAEDAVPRPLRPATIKHRAFQVRMFASALVHRGIAMERITGLDVLVKVKNFREALRFLLDRHGVEGTEAIYNCATAMKAVAKHQVKVPPKHLERLKQICAQVKVKSRGLTDKNRRRLRQFDDPDNVSILLALPARLESLARYARGRKKAELMQMAVAIEFLIMAPIRIGNLASLELGRTLFWTRPGRQGRLLISIPDDEVKNDRPIEFELPEETANLIKRYLELRPLLFDDPGDWLFPGRGGRAKSPGTLGVQIKKTITKHTGLVVNAHLMRHIAAKIYLERHPGSIEVVRRVLVHKSSETTIRHYAGFENKAALRHYDEVILEHRQTTVSRAIPGKLRKPRRRSG